MSKNDVIFELRNIRSTYSGFKGGRKMANMRSMENHEGARICFLVRGNSYIGIISYFGAFATFWDPKKRDFLTLEISIFRHF